MIVVVVLLLLLFTFFKSLDCDDGAEGSPTHGIRRSDDAHVSGEGGQVWHQECVRDGGDQLLAYASVQWSYNDDVACDDPVLVRQQWRLPVDLYTPRREDIYT